MSAFPENLPAQKPSTDWRRYRFLLSLCFGTLLLFVIISRVDVRALKLTFASGSHSLLLSAPLWILVAHVISVVRWKLFLNVAGYTIPFQRLCSSFFANLPAAKFFPSYSGDLLRVLYVADVVPHAFHFGLIGTEALLDVTALFFSLIAGALLLGMNSIALGALFLLCIGAFFALFLHRFVRRFSVRRPFLTRVLEAFRVLQKNPLAALALLLLSGMGWLCTPLFTFQLFVAFGAPIPFATVLLVQPMVTLASLLPVTIGGIGVREGTMLYLYSGLISLPAVILTVGAYYSFVSYIFLPLLSLPIYFYVSRRLREVT